MVPGIISDGRGPNTESSKHSSIPGINGLDTNDFKSCQPVQPPVSMSLQSARDDQVHDLVCVGFGPASLAIAIALHDFLRSSRNCGRDEYIPKVRFLERQAKFGWHAGMLLPGAKMQISFIKDLATLRDPCSHFTFLNYLKEHNRLVQFSNLGTFLPARLEFEDYMRWASNHFTNVVDYGHDVDHIRPRENEHGKIDCLEVQSRDIASGRTTTRFSRNVVIAVGGKAARPELFPAQHNRVLHSSQYSTRIGQILPCKEQAYRIVVVGSGQSAAEVFNDLHTRYPNSATRLIIRDTAMRPSDDSPFVNEVFNPEAVDTFYGQPEKIRDQNLKKNKATNYSVVRLELLEKIYEEQYMQSIRQPDKSKWQNQILASREVVCVDDADNGGVRLTLQSLDSLEPQPNETVTADAVILATGYNRDAHIDILRDCQSLNASKEGNWQAGRNYGLHLDRSQVNDNVGIWLQGCNEDTHGLSDSLLSILATRSGELVHSIFGHSDREHVDYTQPLV